MEIKKTPPRSLSLFGATLLSRSLAMPGPRFGFRANSRWRTPGIAALLLLLAAPATTLVAQTFRGTISGTVTDSSGAAIPGAAVTATETGTGAKHQMMSTSGGDFSFAELPLGDYSVSVSASGFGTTEVNKVPVSAGVVYTLPVKLGVAQAAQTVEVSAAALTLDTTTTTQTTVLPTTTVQNTPMNGRDFTQLIAITPGFAGYSAGGFGSVNGTRANQVNWQIDGSDNNDLWHNIPAVNQGGVSDIAGVTYPLDSIDQFSEQTQSGAAVGRNPGGTVNIVTKSGTNKFHGSVYYYNRNEALADASPFATPDADGKIVKNKLRNQQYGASIGGPIFKDKLFFFTNYEKQQFIIVEPSSSTEPSVAFQNQALALLNQYGVTPNPVQQTVLNTLYPAYALGGGAVANNYSNAAPITGYSYNGVVKLDWQINDKNRLSGRGFGGQGTQTAPVGTNIPYYFEEAPIHIFNYAVVLNTVLSDNMTNQIAAGVNYFNQVFFDQNHSFDVAALGLNTGVDSTLSGTPAITISGFDNLANATPPSGRNDITGTLNDDLTLVKGKHTFTVGGEYRNAQLDEFYQRKKRGNFSYQGSQGPWADPEASGAPSACETATGTANNGKTPIYTDTTTLALADYFAGCTYSDGIVRGDTKRQVFVQTFSVFGQDAWQITPNININYGVRYDYLGPMHDAYKDLSVFRPGYGTLTPPNIVFQGNQISHLYNPAYDNIAPRFGLSWMPSTLASTVVRAGYGVYFDEPNLNPFLDNRPPNGGASGAESNPSGPNPVATITQNYQIIPTNGAALFPATAAFSPASSYGLFSVNPNFRSAYNWNYNLNIEQKLGPNMLATIGYVGSQGRKLLIIRDENQAALGSSSLTAVAPILINGALVTPSTAQAQNATRPFGAATPYYGTVNEVDSAGTSNYNSLQATIKSTNYHGLTSQFSYTWAHGLDLMTQYRNTVPQNSNDLHADYGNMDYDVRNSFVSYLNYSVPTLPGPHWLGSGWQLNGLLTFHTGQPYTIYTGIDSSGTGEGEDRANQIAPVQRLSSGIVNNSGSANWISASSFETPVNQFGTMRRGQNYGPGYKDVDFSVFKDQHIAEYATVQIRAEMFNLFNSINLAPPDSSLSDSGFGTITSTIGNYTGAPGIGPGEPFNTQLAVKIIF
jgi:hypothetical protein